MGRDLLYKPQVPIPMGEEESEAKTKKTEKLGVKAPRGRELGSKAAGKAGAARTKQTSAPQKAPAFKAAYFTEDTSGLGTVNLRSSKMAALRGQEGATDLRKIVLPPSKHGIETPDPKTLRGAGELMGLESGIEPDLESLLGRQGEMTRHQGVTAEMIEARMRELEAMIALRKKALARMQGVESRPVTIDRAIEKDGKALDEVDDVVEEGKELVRETAERASGMHRRIAKTLGIKPK